MFRAIQTCLASRTHRQCCIRAFLSIPQRRSYDVIITSTALLTLHVSGSCPMLSCLALPLLLLPIPILYSYRCSYPFASLRQRLSSGSALVHIILAADTLSEGTNNIDSLHAVIECLAYVTKVFCSSDPFPSLILDPSPLPRSRVRLVTSLLVHRSAKFNDVSWLRRDVLCFSTMTCCLLFGDVIGHFPFVVWFVYFYFSQTTS